jgi:phage gp45-like
MTAGGGSIMNARLSLTDSQGTVRTATTDSSGNYRFDDVQAGETYILTATGKRYSFTQSMQILNINEETNQINFIANSEKRLRVF